jgi:hypothetical protein
MLISHKHKFIYIRLYKTASSTLTKLLRPYLDESCDIATGNKWDYENQPALNTDITFSHFKYAELKSTFKLSDEQLSSYYIFTLERNPWAKFVSANNFAANQKKFVSRTRNQISEQELVEPLPDNPTSFLYWKYIRAWDFYTSNDQLKAEVFKVEQINLLLDTLKDRFNIDIPRKLWDITKMKSQFSPKRHYSMYYNDALRELVARNFNNEINLLGYTYDDRTY